MVNHRLATWVDVALSSPPAALPFLPSPLYHAKRPVFNSTSADSRLVLVATARTLCVLLLESQPLGIGRLDARPKVGLDLLLAVKHRRHFAGAGQHLSRILLPCLRSAASRFLSQLCCVAISVTDDRVLEGLNIVPLEMGSTRECCGDGSQRRENDD